MNTFKTHCLALWLCFAAGCAWPAQAASVVISGFDPNNHTMYTIFTTGAIKGSFVPDWAGLGGTYERGTTFAGKDGPFGPVIYYTVVDEPGFEPAGIHVTPYNNGAGGPDVDFFPNPDPGEYIQDMDIVGATLYAMTGYGSHPPEVFRLNAYTGAPAPCLVAFGKVYPCGVTIHGPSNTADGFTVLPDGNFLINQDDASTTYCEYNSHTGAVVPPCPKITLSKTQFSAGVDYDPVTNLLYFSTWKSGYVGAIMVTDLGGVLKNTIPIAPIFEDIDVHK